MKPTILTLPLGDSPPEARLYYGVSATEGLRLLPDKSVHCIVTSPPYLGMRSYGTISQVWGGKTDCDHDFEMRPADHLRLNPGGSGINRDRGYEDLARQEQHGFCRKCGAWKGNLGVEPTPDCGRPFMELRPDLTPEEVAYVMSELQKAGVLSDVGCGGK